MLIVFVPVTPFGAVAVIVAVPRTCGSMTSLATAAPPSVVTVLVTDPRVVTRPIVVPSATGCPPLTVAVRFRSRKLPQVPAFGNALNVIAAAGAGATGAGRKPRLGQRALKPQFARQAVPRPQMEPKQLLLKPKPQSDAPQLKPKQLLLQKTAFKLQPPTQTFATVL